MQTDIVLHKFLIITVHLEQSVFMDDLFFSTVSFTHLHGSGSGSFP